MVTNLALAELARPGGSWDGAGRQPETPPGLTPNGPDRGLALLIDDHEMPILRSQGRLRRDQFRAAGPA